MGRPKLLLLDEPSMGLARCWSRKSSTWSRPSRPRGHVDHPRRTERLLGPGHRRPRLRGSRDGRCRAACLQGCGGQKACLRMRLPGATHLSPRAILVGLSALRADPGLSRPGALRGAPPPAGGASPSAWLQLRPAGHLGHRAPAGYRGRCREKLSRRLVHAPAALARRCAPGSPPRRVGDAPGLGGLATAQLRLQQRHVILVRAGHQAQQAIACRVCPAARSGPAARPSPVVGQPHEDLRRAALPEGGLAIPGRGVPGPVSPSPRAGQPFCPGWRRAPGIDRLGDKSIHARHHAPGGGRRRRHWRSSRGWQLAPRRQLESNA